MANTAIKDAGELYINGMKTQSLNGEIQVDPGQCRESSNLNDIILTNTVLINKDIKGAGGIDNGTLDNDGLYKIYAIGDSTKYTPSSAILSLDYNTPKLPGYYDMYRYIGWAKFEGGNLDGFICFGDGSRRTFAYDKIIYAVQNGTTLGNLDLSAYVGNEETMVKFLVSYTSSVGTHLGGVKPFGVAFNWAIFSGAAGQFTSLMVDVPARFNNGAPTVTYGVDAGDNLDLLIKSFEVYL